MKKNKTTKTAVPRVDILETPEEVILRADLPGTGPGAVDVRYDRGVLSLHGAVEDRARGETHYLLCEYGVGNYDRSFEIGEEFDAGRIRAELSDGVLSVHLPRKEAAKPRRIDVKSKDESK